MEMEVRQRAEYQIGPAQLLLAELLALPFVGLAGRLDAELDANPALELPEPPSCSTCGLLLWRGRCPQCRYGYRDEREHRVALSFVPAPTDARAELLSHAVAGLGPTDRQIAAYLVADVDDHGVLTEPLPAVAARLGYPVERVRHVVHGLRRAGVPGICAGSLAERLALQVAAVATDVPVPHEVGALLSRGLEELGAGRPGQAAEVSGLTLAQLGSGLAWLRAHLSADIIEHNVAGNPPPPVDVIVRQGAGGLVVETVAGPWSAVRVAPMYVALADDARVQANVVRATRFVEVLGRRERILARVCDVVLDRQAARVTGGPPAHRRLSRRDVAAELGVHESTVSRVVAGKYVLLPSGRTVALATFFGAADGPRECLRDLVAGESVPQSDAELAHALAGRGHVVARRTIAKYRAELGIPRQRNRGGERNGTPGRTTS